MKGTWRGGKAGRGIKGKGKEGAEEERLGPDVKVSILRWHGGQLQGFIVIVALTTTTQSPVCVCVCLCVLAVMSTAGARAHT